MITKFTHGAWHGDHDGDPVQIGDSAGQFVAMTLPCDETIATARDYENAAFIVRACNAHDDLVAALDDLLRAYDRQESSPLIQKYWQQARAALAKAKGES